MPAAREIINGITNSISAHLLPSTSMEAVAHVLYHAVMRLKSVYLDRLCCTGIMKKSLYGIHCFSLSFVFSEKDAAG